MVILAYFMLLWALSSSLWWYFFKSWLSWVEKNGFDLDSNKKIAKYSLKPPKMTKNRSNTLFFKNNFEQQRSVLFVSLSVFMNNKKIWKWAKSELDIAQNSSKKLKQAQNRLYQPFFRNFLGTMEVWTIFLFYCNWTYRHRRIFWKVKISSY